MKAIQIYFGALLAIFLLAFSSCGKEEVIEKFRFINIEFTEIEELRETLFHLYSEKVLIINDTPNAFITDVGYLKYVDENENIVWKSVFESDDPRAFNLITSEEIHVQLPELFTEDGYAASSFLTSVPYRKGVTEFGGGYFRQYFHSNARWILVVQPGSHYFGGRLTNYRRVFHYVLTLEDVITSKRFEVNGVWTFLFLSERVISPSAE